MKHWPTFLFHCLLFAVLCAASRPAQSSVPPRQACDPVVTNTFYLAEDRNPTGYAQVLEEHTAAGNWMPVTLDRAYSYGLDLISHSTFSPLPSTFFYGVDGLGSTRLLTDTNGAVLNTFEARICVTNGTQCCA